MAFMGTYLPIPHMLLFCTHLSRWLVCICRELPIDFTGYILIVWIRIYSQRHNGHLSRKISYGAAIWGEFSTFCSQSLVDFLSKYEVRFQRQKPIDNFIADFYCHKAKLVIEIDGSQHNTGCGKNKDEFRTEILEGYDLKVIRFTNIQINTNFRGVCAYIDAVIKAFLREEGGTR